jgi:UDP-N-acetylglucosamine 3-dehydrogenase
LHAQVYAQLAQCELRAVADINAERAAHVAQSLGVDGYGDYVDLLQREDISAVSICTTDDQHVAPAVAAASAGKHVLVEKPLAQTPEDCDTIIEAASANGVRLMVGQILRFDQRYVTAREEIRSGRIGELVHLFVRRNNPIHNARRLRAFTSVLFFLGIHDIDMLNWCVGARAEKVYARATSRVLGDTPDTVLALLEYPGGVIASLEASWVLPPSFPGRLDARLEAVGSQGALYVNGGSESLIIARERVEQPDVFYAPPVRGERVGILRDELAHFLECVAAGAEPVVVGLDGKAAVEVACAIEESIETGQPVELP